MPTLNDARIEMRLPRAAKQTIERAALASGRTVSDFALDALLTSARSVLEQHQTTALSVRDADTFLALLDADDPPSKTLTDAAARYKAWQEKSAA